MYLIIVRTTDPSGNAGFGFTTVVVPHDQCAEGETLVMAQAASALAAAEAAAAVSPTQTISDIVSSLPGTWTQHGVSEEHGPNQ